MAAFSGCGSQTPRKSPCLTCQPPAAICDHGNQRFRLQTPDQRPGPKSDSLSDRRDGQVDRGGQTGYGESEAILKRYNSYNVTHPTYKAFAEVGKAEKTIFLCDYLASREIQREIHEGLNVVENWNATNDFISYGRQGELATNSREQQEVVTLSLQLLQNCLVLVNTLLMERTIEREGLWESLRPKIFGR